MNRFLNSVYAFMVVMILASCGGSSGPLADISGSGIVSDGPITGFGSVILNGTRFDTNAATFTIDGQTAAQTDLKVGQVVRIAGDSDSLTADTVEYDETVKGPVDVEFNATTGELVVMGQMVQVNGMTVLDDGTSPGSNNSVAFDMSTVQVGDVLEVSGLRDNNDHIVATYIEIKDPTQVDDYKVVGVVRNSGGTEFTIDGLTVDYSVATLDNLPGGVPTDDLLVEVKGLKADYNPTTQTLLASKVEAEAGLDAVEDDEVEIEGIVTSDAGLPGGFEIDNVPVSITNSTQFEGGSVANIAEGARLEVEGVFVNDVLVADEIEFEDNEFRIQATVDPGSINATDRTLTLLGIPVKFALDAELEDNSSADIDPFTFADIADGDELQVNGFIDGPDFIATEVRREDISGRVELRGPVSNINLSGSTLTLTILDVALTADSNTNYEGFGDATINQNDFFAALVDNQTVVEARWNAFVDVAAPLDQLELED